ncbi:MAG: D-amino-acid transaminase [Hyphomonadaceae bacterium]
MSRIAYVNGRYRPLSEPLIAVEDRGFQFADAVYEVWGVRAGALLDEAAHFARLRRSLGELKIAAPAGEKALGLVLRETLRRNRVRDGLVYLQISRGAAPRDHAFPEPAPPATIVVTAHTIPAETFAARATGVSVITLPEMRWARCDIKTVGLTANVLAKEAAHAAGAGEVWFLDPDGTVIEGASSNAWIVDADGRLRTRPLSNALLHGVTRAAFIRIAQAMQIAFDERAFTITEALAAREAFISSATNVATPVLCIDGCAIGAGAPGPVAQALRDAYFGAAAPAA